jgi:hypothetical protein
MKKIVLSLMVVVTASILYAQPPNVPADKGTVFGQKTTAENAISVDQLVGILNSKKEGDKKVEVKLKAIVTDVCTAEGCWIKVKNADGKMMVKMKDHKFLVPLVLNNKEIIIEGIAEEKVTSVEMLKHYAEDAGKSKEEIAAIKEPKKEITVQAKGILVL